METVTHVTCHGEAESEDGSDLRQKLLTGMKGIKGEPKNRLLVIPGEDPESSLSYLTKATTALTQRAAVKTPNLG